MLARRVMHERTGVYADKGAETVARAHPSIWVDSSGAENCDREATPEYCAEWERNIIRRIEKRWESEKPERKVRKRDAGSGSLIGVRLEGNQVLYTVKRDDGSEYEFYVEKDSHSDSVDTHGNLLGKEIEWDEEYFKFKEW